MTVRIPGHLADKPRDRAGLVVPWTSSWSSEHWAKALAEPRLDNRLCLFTAGRQFRGNPILGAMNEPRQREAVLEGLCQVCGTKFADADERFLPLIDWSAHMDDGTPVTSDPPCCGPCATYATEACPVIAARPHRIVRFTAKPLLVLQLVDPSLAPSRKHLRFDADEDRDRARLGGIVKRLGPLVGLVKQGVTDFEEV